MRIVKLGDIAQVTTGKTPSKSSNIYYLDGTIPFVKPPNLGGAVEITSTEEYLTTDGAKQANLIPKNSIMVSCIGSLGKVGIAGCDLVTNQQINSLTFNPKLVNYKYGYYFALTLAPLLKQVANSAVVPIVNKTTFSNFSFVLHPLEEQKRIVKLLDQADELRQKRKQAIDLLDDYLKSVFLDMFGNPGMNPHKYEKCTIQEIADKVTDGEHITPIRTIDGIKLLSARNIKNGYLDFNAGVDYIGEVEYERIRKRCNPELGDVLISCSGTIGRVTTIDIDEPFTLVRSAALIKPNRSLILSKYLEYFLRTDYSQREMMRSVNQSSQANLFLGKINKLSILLPPITKQLDFVNRFNSVVSIKQKMLIQSSEMENQFQALMQKSFLPSTNATYEYENSPSF